MLIYSCAPSTRCMGLGIETESTPKPEFKSSQTIPLSMRAGKHNNHYLELSVARGHLVANCWLLHDPLK